MLYGSIMVQESLINWRSGSSVVVSCLYLYCNETDTNCRFLRGAPDAAWWDGMLWAGAVFFVDSRLGVELPPVVFLFPCHRFVVVRLDSLPQRNSDCLCAIAWLH